MPTPQTSERPLTPKQVAEIFGVSTVTVASWADSGKLPHFKTPSGQRRFWKSDMDAFLIRLRPSTHEEAAS